MSPTYTNVADICIPLIDFSSSGRAVRPLRRPFPQPCRARQPRSQPMSGGTSDPVRYFGRQVRNARLAKGWTLAEFGQRIGYTPGAISRIENGNRPPTEMFAQMCDRAISERDGW